LAASRGMSQGDVTSVHIGVSMTTYRTDAAGPSTPFIYNAWYVAAVATEITRAPIARTILGRSIVFYRTESGSVVALQNRCCHRSFPLVHGRIEGDTIVCGYHGLRYDQSGRCVEVPMQRSVPASLRVRAYCALDRGPFVWIWMGEPTEAELITLPHQEWMDHPEWDTRWSFLYVKGNYVHLHENLLDLSHLTFLHAKTFGTPEYARTPPVENDANGGNFEVWRHVECELPPIYAEPLGWQGVRALRSSGSQYVAPGLHVNTGVFRRLDREKDEGAASPTVKVAQLLTPETARTTHYWTLLARNFALGKAAVGEFMINQQMAAFHEDAFAIERINELQELEANAAFREISIPTDKAGVLMRRHLKNLADLERPATESFAQSADADEPRGTLHS
jgi:phenylpropionate dioxygenase-like ring-hydroxylating dioxygenase large terminal subunit